MPNRLLRRRRAAKGKKHLLLAEPVQAVVPLRRGWGTATSEIEQGRQPGGCQPIQLQFTPPPECRWCGGLLRTVYGRCADPGLTAEGLHHLLRAAIATAAWRGGVAVGTYPSTMGAANQSGAAVGAGGQRTGPADSALRAIDNGWSRAQAGQGIGSCLNLMAGLPAENRPALLPFYPEPVSALSSPGRRPSRQEPNVPGAGCAPLGWLWLSPSSNSGTSGLARIAPPIDHLTNQVGGAARPGSTPAAGPGRTASLPAESWAAATVNVQKPGWEGFDQPGGDDPQSSPPSHQVDTGCGEGLDQGLIEILPLAIQAVIQADAVTAALGPARWAPQPVFD